MKSDPLESVPSYDLTASFYARRPRHEPGPARSRTAILFSACASDEWTEAQLIDVSRSGVKVGLATEVAKETPANIVVQAADGATLLARASVVRWCKPEGNDRFPWHVGLEFPEPLEWETLGELFLQGVLDAGGAAS